MTTLNLKTKILKYKISNLKPLTLLPYNLKKPMYHILKLNNLELKKQLYVVLGTFLPQYNIQTYNKL